MRPSDENQAGSHPNVHPHLRPNLMSSARRSGHEDSILAKLEREPARRARQGNGLRLAWYGGAALVAVGLTVTLAWLAAGTGAQAQGPGQASEGGLAIVAAPGLERAASPPMPTPALIVDSAHDPAPPLRMLDTPITKAPVEAAPPTMVAAPPEPVRGPRIAARPEPAPEPKPEARTASRSAAGGAKPRSVARSGARPTNQQQRTVNPARNNEHDDSDVALISAIISHANGPAGGDNGGNDEKPSSCADDACRSRPARQ